MFSFGVFLPAFISFALTVMLCPIFIPILHRMKFGQFVREEGPESHLKKAGTPTMGGIVMLAVFAIVGVAYVVSEPELFPVILLTVGFGFIGFLDDYIKLVMKRSLGLRAWQKLGLQIVVTAVFAFIIMHCNSFYIWEISMGIRLFIYSICIYNSSWNCKWGKFYRWT